MKKILSVLIIIFLSFLAVSCGDTTEDGDTPNLKVALVLTGAINDGGWNQRGYEGLMSIKDKYKATVAYNENTQPAQYNQIIRTYAKEGYGIIIANGAQFTDAVYEVAAEYPDIKFLITSSDRNSEFGNGSNVAGVLADGVEQGFLQGATAAYLAEELGSNKVAGIGGTEIPAFKTIVEGYVVGAKYVKEDIEVVTAFTGSIDDVNKMKEQALAFIDQGADVVMSYANQASRGGYEATLDRGKLSIGTSASKQLFDTYEKSLSASSNVNLSHAILEVTDYIANEEFEGINYIFGVKEDVVTIVFNEKEPTVQLVKDKVEVIVDKIKSGEIDVQKLYDESK